MLGPVLAAAAYALLPDAYRDGAGHGVAFSHAGRVTAALAVWMATWWMTEAIPIYATALLPLAVLPLLRARSMKDAAAPYAHELIFLFLGGFLVALAMQRWGLHRRLALTALRWVGDRPANMVGGFMAVSAGLSMWVSNTATAIMLLPVATSVIEVVGDGGEHREEIRPFALALLLGIAYGASIGGIATPIGTPPNLFLLSYIQAELGIEISFLRWMAIGVPLVVCFLPLTWLLLTRWLYPMRMPRIEGGAERVRRALAELGPMSWGERCVLAVFAVACTLWVTRPLLVRLELFGVHPLAGLRDAGIAMLCALALFVIPVDRRRGEFVLDWQTALGVPWGILLLFGGGLSLAAAIGANGVAELLGAQVAGFAGISSLWVVLAVVTGIVFLTELTSNTATAATLIPILASLAPGLGLHPLLLAVPAGIAASCAFMLPVATPPNAIVFASGHVSIAQMARAGLWLNLGAAVVITLIVYLGIRLVIA